MQLVARQHTSVRFDGLRVTLLHFVPLAQEHERVEVQSLQAIAVLQVPVAHRLAVQEVAAKARQRPLEARWRETTPMSFIFGSN